LLQNCAKRIDTLAKTRFKKQKEINDKRIESEELETKARILQSNVDQRMQIMNLKSNTQ
jgi:putative lipase involved disintegration of autophagic bodies